MDSMIGRVVLSKAGRDKKKTFVIVGILDEKYVIISDGNLRKIAKPKKKKLKHLNILDLVLLNIKSKLVANVEIFDSEIRKALEINQINL